MNTWSVSPVNLIGDDTFTDSIDLNEVHLDLKMEINEISSRSWCFEVYLHTMTRNIILSLTKMSLLLNLRLLLYCRFNIVYVNLIKLDCIRKVCEERAQFPLARLLLYCGDVTDIGPSFTCFAPYCAGIVGCLCAVVSVGYLTPFGYMHFCHGNLLKITDLR